MTVTCGIQPTSVVTMAMKVLHDTCNMCICDLPNMNVLIPWACGPQASSIHIRKIPDTHVTTILTGQVGLMAMQMHYPINILVQSAQMHTAPLELCQQSNSHADLHPAQPEGEKSFKPSKKMTNQPQNVPRTEPGIPQVFPTMGTANVVKWYFMASLCAAREDQGRMQLVISKKICQDILRELHEGVVGGHLGEVKTLSKLKERFYWPGRYYDVRDWCQTCKACAKWKSPVQGRQTPMQTITAGYPTQYIAVNLLRPFSESMNGM